MSSSRGIIEIDTEAELRAIIQKLNSLPDQIAAPNILKNAINATARKVKNQITKDAKARYAVKDKGIFKKEGQGAPKVSTASPATLTATITSKGLMQDIMVFMTRPNAGTGAAAAKVLNTGAMKSLEMGGLKAFVTRFASGHMAIVQRKGSAHLPVKKLLSPAVPMMLGNEEIQAKAETLTITGNAKLVAFQCVTVVGLGKLSGKYYIDNSMHHIGQGYTMELELSLVESMTEEVIKDATEQLAAVGVMNTPAYWVAHYKDVNYLDGLILNMATRIKINRGGTSIITVAAALEVLTRTGVINSPDYWAGKINGATIDLN